MFTTKSTVKRNLKLLPLIAAFFLLCFAVLDVHAQEGTTERHAKADYDQERLKILDKIRKRWSTQIEKASSEQNTKKLDLRSADGEIVIHGGYEATSILNPMVTEKCRMESLAESVMTLSHDKNLSFEAAFNKAENHIHDRQEKAGNGILFTKWIEHVAECKSFCNIAVMDLLQCHIESVATHKHDIVLFNFDSDRVIDDYLHGNVSDFARDIKGSSEKSILILARSSQAGGAGKGYNRDLSIRRGEAVKSALMAKNVPDNKITVKYLGNEAPQLNEWIAGIYGLDNEFKESGEIGINQSVVMVLY